MELWFWAAVGGGVFAGFSNFCFKVAAKRNYNAEVFTLIGGITSVVFASVFVLVSGVSLFGFGLLSIFMILAGAIAACGGIMKVYALHNIDSTIFFPLFKLLSPLLALVYGLLFFNESHTTIEWFGLLLGLTVPLLLITNVEKSRQHNLILGLIFVFLIAVTSSAAAAINKLAIDLTMPVSVALWFASTGVALGTILLMIIQTKGVFTRFFSLSELSTGLVMYATARSLLISLSLTLILYAYIDGTLGVVQTIHSMYILIPIVLSIIFYNEHWNMQKALAIVLSVASLALLG